MTRKCLAGAGLTKPLPASSRSRPGLSNPFSPTPASQVLLPPVVAMVRNPPGGDLPLRARSNRAVHRIRQCGYFGRIGGHRNRISLARQRLPKVRAEIDEIADGDLLIV